MIDLYSKRSLKTYVFEALVLIATAFVYSLAFPGFVTDYGLGFIAFFALIPVFMVLHNCSWKIAPLWGFLFGFMFYIFFNYWLKSFHPLAILIAPIIKGGEMFILFAVMKLIDKAFGRMRYLLLSIAWVAYAYISQTWFAGYPYGTLGYAPYRFLPFIQIADIAGVWGITFVMLIPQVWAGLYLGDLLEGKKVRFLSYVKKYLVDIIVYAVLFIAILIYGFVSMAEWDDREPDDMLRVAAIQHSADNWKGGYMTYKRNFNNLRVMSLEALRENPDMIIWSETAFVPSVEWHNNYPNDEETAALVDEFVDFGKSLPVPLITGNPEGVLKDPDLPPYFEDGTWNRTDYNTIIFFENGEIKKTYRKQHLVPFTEHFPYEKQMPWLYNLLLANDYQWWEEGTEPVVFETEDGITFCTPICFEDVFGEITADFVNNGANLILNMTNDGWAGAVTTETQHMAIAAFRSIETRKSTVRGTNSGITCMISPTGRISGIMEPFKAGWTIYDVPIYEGGSTFYTEHINLFGIVCYWMTWAISIAAIIILVVKKVRKH